MITKLLAGLFIFCVWTYTSSAQLTINNTFTPTQLVQDYLVGTGVTISNVTVNGGSDARQFAQFNNGALPSNLPISSGVMLTTGYSDDFNNVGNTTGDFASLGTAFPCNGGGICGPGDNDLNTIISPIPTFDAAVLEFDFVPVSDTIRFRYAFASEEYDEYVCAGVNDVFAFLISGPGFAGPTNIATIPGTSPVLPVSIDNVNNGSIGSNGLASNCTASQLANSAFFVSNAVSTTFQFDGLTVLMEAVAVVVPCSTYHIKLAIADAFDGVWDSAVFLEAGSFTSSGLKVQQITANNDSIVTEQCNWGQITFEFPSPLAIDTTFYFTIGGTATNGVDYVTIPDSLTVMAGDSIGQLIIFPIADTLIEGVESVVLIIPTNFCASDTLTLYIGEEIPPPAPDSIRCSIIQDSIIAFEWNAMPNATGYEVSMDNGLTWIPSSGNLQHQLVGFPTNTNAVIWVRSLDSSLICTIPLYDSLVCLNCSMEASVDTTGQTCVGFNDGIANLSMIEGTAPYVYNWSNGAATLNLTNVAGGGHTLSVTDNNGCTLTVPIVIPEVGPIVLNIDESNNTLACDQLPTGALSVLASGSAGTYTYLWNNNAVTTAANSNLDVGTYFVTVTDGTCTTTDSATVVAPVAPSIDPFITQSPTTDTVIFLTQSVTVDANSANTSASYSYTWSEINSNSNTGIASPNQAISDVLPTDTGTYVLMIVVNVNTNGIICSDSGQVTLVVAEQFRGIPDAFSPNNDQVNDYFKPLVYPSYIKQFKIYNRFSDLVYDNNTPDTGWDGKYNGVEQPTEVYIYLLEYQLPGQEPVILRGNVSLIR